MQSTFAVPREEILVVRTYAAGEGFVGRSGHGLADGNRARPASGALSPLGTRRTLRGKGKTDLVVPIQYLRPDQPLKKGTFLVNLGRWAH